MATAPADLTNKSLGTFEGLDVRRAGIEIPGAAGGLRDAMKIEPRSMHQGDTVYVVLECTVQKVRFDPIDREDPGGDQERVHVLKAETATFVDGGLVADTLDVHKERIARVKEAEEGTQRLPDDAEVRALVEEHGRGEHADSLRGSCPDCQDEADANDAELTEPTPIGRKAAGS